MRSLRPYLELRADMVESVFSAHRAPGRVTGGTVGPWLIRFYILPAPYVHFTGIQRGAKTWPWACVFHRYGSL